MGGAAKRAKVTGWVATLIVGMPWPVLAQAQFEVSAIPLESSGPQSFKAGDVDGDGDVDLLWFPLGSIQLSLNDGHGAFTRAVNRVPAGLVPAILLVDVDGDGDLDIVSDTAVGFSMEIALNNGRGVFSHGSTMFQGYFASAAADFDGDGVPDLALGGLGQTVDLWRGTGGARFTQVAGFRHTSPLRLRAADLNGDRIPDLIVGDYAGLIDVFLNQGSWIFTQSSAITPQLSQWNPFTLADVDGDGDLDLLSIAYIRSSLWFNNGAGGFSEDPTALPAPVTYSEDAAFADIDEDGDLDLFVGNFGQPDQLYLNDGRGRFTEVTWTRLLGPARLTTQVAAVDVDGDGDIDLIAANIPAPSTLYRNLLRDASFQGPVRIGGTASVRLTARRGFATAPQAGLAALSVRPLLAPVTLTGLGRWWLDPRDLIFLPTVVIPAPSGETAIQIPVPASGSLVGQTVSVQAVVAHEADPASWRFTNVGRAVIQ